jgi:hypothetical protein
MTCMNLCHLPTKPQVSLVLYISLLFIFYPRKRDASSFQSKSPLCVLGPTFLIPLHTFLSVFQHSSPHPFPIKNTLVNKTGFNDFFFFGGTGV